jgi:predicted outer membrane repeat protein
VLTGGTFQGDNTNCEIPCPAEPIGACCITETCVEVADFLCTEYNGQYQGEGESCSEELCEALLHIGACCVDEVCIVVSELSCPDFGGFVGEYQGDGTSCASYPCTPPAVTGACCVGEVCSIVSQANCEVSNGTYQGDVTVCESDTCDTPVGACCALGQCLPDTPVEACAVLSGFYQGDGSSCDSSPCDDSQESGACCISNACSTLVQSTCISNGGQYLGDGVLCRYDSCALPSETGACCVLNACSPGITEDACLALEGTYQGDDTTCTFNLCDTGACCAQEQCFAPMTHDDCSTIGGEYEGNNTTCESEPCTPAILGACCVNALCIFVPEASCEVFGGVYEGDEIACEDVVCAAVSSAGACCVDASCVFMPEADCEALAGVYQGDESSCEDAPCAGEGIGACCVIGVCSVITEIACLDQAGDYQGDDVVCSDASCDGNAGACCIDGICSMRTLLDCVQSGGAGENFEMGIRCDAIVCEPNSGACCIGSSCVFMQQQHCASLDGTYFGDDVICENIVCDVIATGACCLSNLACTEEATEATCVETGGVYHGDTIFCADVDCACQTAIPETPITASGACLGETITLTAVDESLFSYDWQVRDPGDLTWDTLLGGTSMAQQVMNKEGTWVFQYRQRAYGCAWSEWNLIVAQVTVTDCAPTGACCIEGECTQSTIAECEGAYLGDWTTCENGGCVPGEEGATGACCVADECSIVSVTDCSGTYFGDGTTCENISCVEGAVGSCCIVGSCYRIAFEDCLAEDGEYRGDDSVCWHNPCDVVQLGACCFGTDCQETTEEDCFGQWQEGTECESDTCANDEYVIGPFQWKVEEGGNDHWYAIVVPSEEICWDDANARSVSDGGYLLSLTTEEERAWWLSAFNGSGQEPFIGLAQQQGSAEPAEGWEWTTGEGVTLDGWLFGAPSDETGDRNVAQLFASGYWNDEENCQAPSYAVEFGQWFNVCETCEYTTIQEAVDDASDIETIYVGSGTYRTVDGLSLVDLQGKDISLIGEGSERTILDGELSVSGLRFEYGIGGSARLEGLTIQYCYGENGAGIVVDGGGLEIVDCVLEHNRALEAGASGGALHALNGADVLLENCDLQSNLAAQFGGGIFAENDGTSVHVMDCLLTLHTASSGGAIYATDSAICVVEDTEFSENLVSFDGGGASVKNDGSSFLYCCFKDNIAGGFGGGLDNQAGANTNVSNCLFIDNSSAFGGGGIYNLNSNPAVYKCTFANNVAQEENGGAIHNDGTSYPSIEGTLFCGNIGNAVDESTLEGHIFPTIAGSGYEFVGENEFHALCSTCQGDVNGDSVLDLTDLVAIAIMMTWGECNGCLEDIDGNGVVDPDDIIAFVELLSARLDLPCSVECPYR